MQLEQHSIDALRISGIPGYMQDGIISYYKHGWQPGGFLCALINNDLMETFAHADETNKHCILQYVLWFYNYAPSGTWGYATAVGDYIKMKEKEVADAVESRARETG